MLPVGAGIAAGVFLNSLKSKVDQIIENAKQAGITLELQAGNQVELAIERAKNVYQDQLQKTVDKVDQEFQNVIGTLNSMVNDIGTKVEQVLKDTASRAQQLVNSSILGKNCPLLRDYSPQLLKTTDLQQPIELTFVGNFPQIGAEENKPTLEFGEGNNKRSINALETTTTEKIVFKVNTDDLLLGAPLSNSRITLIHGKVTMPWKKGFFGITALTGGESSLPIPLEGPSTALHLPHPFHKVYSYDISLGILPPNLGRIKFECKKMIPQREEKVYVPANQQHYNEGQAGDYAENINSEDAANGWHVKPGTSFFQNCGSNGMEGKAWGCSFKWENDQSVCYHVWSQHLGMFDGKSGPLDFKLGFTQYRYVPREENSFHDFDLAWVGVLTLTNELDQIKEWKITYVGYDGNPISVSLPGRINEFVNIKRWGNTLYAITGVKDTDGQPSATCSIQ